MSTLVSVSLTVHDKLNPVQIQQQHLKELLRLGFCEHSGVVQVNFDVTQGSRRKLLASLVTRV